MSDSEHIPFSIREERPEDFPVLRTFIRTAFRTAPVSSGDEQDFTDRLRASPGYCPHLALVAESGSSIVGYILLTRFPAARSAGFRSVPLLAAPLCVDSEHRAQGIGSALMREAMRRAAAAGYPAVLLVGDPAYYGRFGYRPSTDYGIRNADGIPDRYVQLAELIPGALAGSEGSVSFAGM